MAEVVGELAGKASLVTGAGVGIGRAIAMKLASEGARVLVVDFNEETAHQTASDIVSAGGQAKAFVADVSDEVVWRAWCRQPSITLVRSILPATVPQ